MGTPQTASRAPPPPPSSDITRLSVTACRTSRRRDAPSATRVASSSRRPAAWARKRLTTLAQVTSSTQTTAPNRTSSCVRTRPTRRSRRPSAPSVRGSFVNESSPSAPPITASSAFASASVRPGASRPTTMRDRHDPSAVTGTSGTQHAPGIALDTVPSSSPMTPTMSTRSPPASRICLPTTSGSAPKRPRQSASLRMTTVGDGGARSTAPRRARAASYSAGVKPRPRTGLTPSTSK